MLERNSIAFFFNRRAIRGAWHLAPIAAIGHRLNHSSAFFCPLKDRKDLKDINAVVHYRKSWWFVKTQTTGIAPIAAIGHLLNLSSAFFVLSVISVL